MMINFPGLSKLKTKKIVFEEVISAANAVTLEQLQELSCRRRAIEESINDSSSGTKTTARDVSRDLTSRYAQDVQKLEGYLPLLENLAYHVNSLFRENPYLVNRWTSHLKIRWNSTLSSACLFQAKGLKYFQVDDIQFELAMVLFLYGHMLREHALSILQTDLVQSATLLRKAAGVYQYLALYVLPSLKTTKSSERPPDSLSSVSSVMSLICLAEAQAVTARKAEEKGNAPSLLSKLHYGCREFLDEALGLLPSAVKECKDISPKFMEFVATYRTLHELKSYKYHAESLKIDNKIGDAIGVLRLAISNAEKNASPKEASWRSVHKQEIEDLKKQLKKFENENNFLEQVKVPMKYDLPLPQAVKIVNSIPYQPQRTNKILIFKI